MAYSSPAAPVTGTTISKTTFGDVVKADLDFLANPPACRVYHNAAQSIPNVTGTLLAFNSERYDTDTMHDTVTNNSRITIKTAGLYVVTLNFTWPTNGTGERRASIFLNGATQIAFSSTSPAQITTDNGICLATIYKLAVNDYLTVQVYQSSGGALNVNSGSNYSPEFAATWVGLG